MFTTPAILLPTLIGAFYRRASSVLGSLSVLFPTKIKVVDHSFPSRAEYRQWLIEGGFREKVSDARAHGHSSSPFTWIAEIIFFQATLH